MSDFGRLIEQEVPRLRRYARALTRDIGQADDLVQSCLVCALAKEHLWQPGSNLRAWILTVLHNLHINRIRRLIREQDNAIVASASLALSQTEPSARLDLLDVERAIGKLPELPAPGDLADRARRYALRRGSANPGGPYRHHPVADRARPADATRAAGTRHRRCGLVR